MKITYGTRRVSKAPAATPEQLRAAQKWIAHRLGFGPPLDDTDRAALAKDAERVERLLEDRQDHG
jgi:hypothetical protein